jgi:hypothetical protein
MKDKTIPWSHRGKLGVCSLFMGTFSIAFPLVGPELLPWRLVWKNAFAYVVLPGGGLVLGLLLGILGLKSERKSWAIMGTAVCAIGLILWSLWTGYYFVQTHS